MRRLKQDVIEAIRSDIQIFLDVCRTSNVKQSAINRQLKFNDDLLTRYDVLDLLAKKLDRPIEALLEDQSAKA